MNREAVMLTEEQMKLHKTHRVMMTNVVAAIWAHCIENGQGPAMTVAMAWKAVLAAGEQNITYMLELTSHNRQETSEEIDLMTQELLEYLAAYKVKGPKK